jgi:hypothetical protein
VCTRWECVQGGSVGAASVLENARGNASVEAASKKGRLQYRLDRKVEAVLKSPFEGSRSGSTPRSSGSTASRSPLRISSSSRSNSLFADRFRLKPHVREIFRHLDVTRRYTLKVFSDEL